MSFADPKALAADGRTFTHWSESDVRLLRLVHEDLPDRLIARMLGKTEKSVRSMAWRLGLKKSKERLAEMGRENVAARWRKR